MGRFSTDTLNLSIDSATTKRFQTTELITYTTNILGAPAMLAIEPFYTDLTSTKWWFSWKIGKVQYALSAVLHDYLQYRRTLEGDAYYTWRQIDQMYREALIDQGIPEFECRLRYYGVRANTLIKVELPSYIRRLL